MKTKGDFAEDGEEWTYIDYDRIQQITERAVLLMIDEGEWWVPLSVMGDPPEKGSGSGEVPVKTWWATKQGLV